MSIEYFKLETIGRPVGIRMNGGDYFEFSVAHDRKYTLDHLWVQVLDDDEDDMTVKLGISEFIRAEYGDIVKVVLSKPEDDSEFQIDLGESGAALSEQDKRMLVDDRPELFIDSELSEAEYVAARASFEVEHRRSICRRALVDECCDVQSNGVWVI